MIKKNVRRSRSEGAAKVWVMTAIAVLAVGALAWWWKGHEAASTDGPAAASSAASGAAGRPVITANAGD